MFAYMLFFAGSAELARSHAMLIGSASTVLVAILLAIQARQLLRARGREHPARCHGTLATSARRGAGGVERHRTPPL